jgi:hypothetical protein
MRDNRGGNREVRERDEDGEKERERETGRSTDKEIRKQQDVE